MTTHARPIFAAAGKGSAMQKGLAWGALAASGLLVLVFLLDLILGFPFERTSIGLDVMSLLAAGLLAYLSWDTLREQR